MSKPQLDTQSPAIISHSHAPEERIRRQAVFQTSGILWLDNGIISNGNVKNMSFDGITFIPEILPTGIKSDDVGKFTLLINETYERLLSSSMCKVAHVCADAVEIEFLEEKRPCCHIYVRRSNGTFETGWEIANVTDVIPKNIEDVVVQKSAKNQCVVCIHRGEGDVGNRYKVYSTKQLIDIQRHVYKTRRAIGIAK